MDPQPWYLTMRRLDIVAEIDHTGALSKGGRGKVRAHLRARAVNAGLEEGDTLPLRFRVNERVRSGAQHRLYFAMVGEVVRALDEAGYTAEQQKKRLHAYYKDTYLDLVAAEILREIGEECDIGGLIELPGGKVIRTLTTTRLSVPAYSLFIERVAADETVTIASGADLSEILGETRSLLAAGKITSGKIYETSEEATMDFGAPSPTETAGSPTETGEDEMTAYEMQLRAAELW